MAENTSDIAELEKLVNSIPLATREPGVEKLASSNKRSYRKRKIAPAHIRAKLIKDRTYYYYCRGIDKEVYLGSADLILKAVKRIRGSGEGQGI